MLFQMSSVRLFVDEAQTSEVNNRSSPIDEGSCGQICSTEFSSKQDGRYYPLLRKHVDCSNIMRRMARQVSLLSHPPRYPPTDAISSFTQHGQCPITKISYFDDSNSSSSKSKLHFSASKFRQLMMADRRGKKITHYGDPKRRIKPALVRYRHYIYNASVAVVGTLMPWAEAMLMNLGAKRITTLEYQSVVIDHKRVVTITPSQFATNFLQAMKNRKEVCCTSNLFLR